MTKPVVIVVGADKGGVGKTTVSRTLLDYFSANNVPTRAFDTESPRGTLKRFHPEITEIRFSCPNNHHFVVDLTPFGQDNPNVVFYAADRPYGKIEASVVRKGVPSEPRAWSTVPSFA